MAIGRSFVKPGTSFDLTRRQFCPGDKTIFFLGHRILMMDCKGTVRKKFKFWQTVIWLHDKDYPCMDTNIQLSTIMFLKQYCIPPKKKNKLFLKFFLCDKFRFELHFYSNIIIIFLSQCFLLFGKWNISF